MKKVKGFFKKNELLATNLLIIVCGAIFAFLLSYSSLDSMMKKDMERTTNALFDGIYSSISSRLEYSANFTNGMCNDYFLQSMLEKEDEMPEEEFEQLMANYLDNIRKANKWEGTYLISCKTKKYYTPQGIGKTVDATKDKYDLWYENFVKSGIEYGADLTYDQFNDKCYVIFTDRRMEVDGKLRAVLGCAMYLSDVTDIIKKQAKKYNVDVCLTDKTGKTTLDDKGVNLVESYYSRYYTSDMKKRNQIYTKDGYIIRKYIPDMGMYLVVKNKHYTVANQFMSIFAGTVFYAIVMIIILTCFNFYKFKGEKAILKSNTYKDFLTKIFNVKGLQSNINLFINDKSRNIEGAAMFMLDIDNFKEVNDTFGHGKGDELIIKFANELSKEFRSGDIVGRLGGDEFMVFSPTLSDRKSIEKKAKELQNKLKWTIEENGIKVYVSVSIGVAIYPTDGKSYEELYKLADKALYYVKEHEKNGYCIYSEKIFKEDMS
ncbi:diguanylate cyclase (GGDEF) domain-containing protein [Lachnospiraceae bacterium C7]|nr:diguanylate cyclase (GGDEF) domain-containing protein [Lachnospiraceae bacterium C7]